MEEVYDSVNSTPGEIYGLVKTHKVNNPVRVITTGCNTATRNLSVYIEHVLYELSGSIPSKIKDSNHLFDMIDNINNMFLPTNTILVNFHIAKMFPKIDNKSGLNAVKSVSANTPPTDCILEGLELCLACINFIFNIKNFLQIDGTLQGLQMSCSYSDIVVSKFDTAALQYHIQPALWKIF